MTSKQPPCCARLTGKVVSKKGELSTLARREAYAHQKGRPTDRYAALITQAKAALAAAEAMVVEHEAGHADDAV
jgi:hypothetical protein